MRPLPTPYDIVELPVFAWTPSSLFLIIFIILILVLAFASWAFFRSRSQPARVEAALALAIRELRAVVSRPLAARDMATQASLIVRRAFSIKSEMHVISMSRAELLDLRNSSVHKIEKELLTLILDLEEFKYSKEYHGPLEAILNKCLQLLFEWKLAPNPTDAKLSGS